MSVTRGCVLMDLPRSTIYDAPSVAVDDSEIVRRMRTICDEFETYGCRRVGAALRQDGTVVNSANTICNPNGAGGLSPPPTATRDMVRAVFAGICL